MTLIETWFPYVLPSVPGCSDLLAIQAIRSAAIKFCTKSDLIQRVITADCTSGVEDYVITPPTDMTLQRVLSVSWSGNVLIPASPDLIVQDVVLRGIAVGTGTPATGNPTWFFQKTPTDPGFSLYPIPNATLTLGLTVKVSFTPSNAATTLDDNLYVNWVEDIANGAIALLMLMPGQQFTNAMAPAYAKSFGTSITRAKRQKNSGTLTNQPRVLARRFA